MSRNTSGVGSSFPKVPSAATKQDAARPSPEQAFDAFCVLLAFARGQTTTARTYTQWDLPADVRSSDAYKRRHRELRKAGVEGAYARGKLLVCTHTAWMTDLVKPKAAKLALVTPVVDREGEIDRALGIVTRGAR